VRDGRELVAETESIDTSVVSVPLEQCSWFPCDMVNRLVAWRRN